MLLVALVCLPADPRLPAPLSSFPWGFPMKELCRSPRLLTPHPPASLYKQRSLGQMSIPDDSCLGFQVI